MEKEKHVSVVVDSVDSSVSGSLDQIPIQLKFKNIKYQVNSPSTLFCGGKKPPKIILDGVSAVANPGRLLAVMGPSGSGKSTLLDVLMRRQGANRGFSGEILLNGEPIDKFHDLLHRLVAYVMQDDETLTLNETLKIAAELKLPSTMSRVAKQQRINQVIQDLGLENCRNTKVGGPTIRGLSGGEKRRLGIAIELLASPSVILLDEPTSGLSATDALSVMSSIKRLASHNRTVVCTIHQPRSEIFEMFDQILLLGDGKVAYFGPSENVLEYFANLGYQCPFGWNLGDFLLDLVTLELSAKNNPDLQRLAKQYTLTSKSQKNIIKSYNEFSKKSDSSSQGLQQQAMSCTNTISVAKILQEYPSKYAAGFFKQFFVLLYRNFLHYLRHPAIFWTQLTIHIVFAVISGSIFSQLRDKLFGNVEYNVGILLFWNSQFCAIMTFSAIPQLILERALFERESKSGLYRTSSYFLAKTIVEFIFYSITTMSYIAIVYFWVGLRIEGFFYALICILLFVNVSLSSIAAVGAIAPNVDVGMAIVSFINTLNLLFSGFLVPYQSIPSGWKWIYHIVHYQYSFTGLTINEFEGRSEATLQYFDIDTSYGKWERIYILIGFMIGFRFIAYLLLVFSRK